MSKKIKKQTGLGKGLGALIPDIEFSPDKGFKVISDKGITDSSFSFIDISQIHKNPYQPRQDFDPQALDDLKNSILQHGIIQPITVRREINGYELIAGERRLKAAIMAGIKEIPAYILDIDHGIEMLEIALIENLQREDLNPIETAYGYQRLIDECKLTQEQVAAKVGKDRSTVTNFLRLLKLPDSIKESIRKKEISMGHARAILSLASSGLIEVVWKKIIEQNLSVRTTENLVRDIENGKIILSKDGKSREINKNYTKPNEANALNSIKEDIEDNLRQIFGTNVKIVTKSEQSGYINVEFYSLDDFQRLIELCILISERKIPIESFEKVKQK